MLRDEHEHEGGGLARLHTPACVRLFGIFLRAVVACEVRLTVDRVMEAPPADARLKPGSLRPDTR